MAIVSLLGNAANSGVPIVAVRTADQPAVAGQITACFGSAGWAVVCWDSVRGCLAGNSAGTQALALLTSEVGDASILQDFTACLTASLAVMPQKTVLLAQGAHRILFDSRPAQAVLNLRDSFCDAYEDVIDAQRAVLGPLFDITDYPVLSELRARFGVSYRWLALGVPEQLAEISVDLYNQQVQVQQEALAATMAEVQQGLRASLKGLIDHLLNRLSEKDEAGRVKRLHGSAVDKIVEFLDLLPAKNVTGDQELQRLAERARSIVTAVDVETLKKPGFERAIVEKRLGEITKSIDGLLETGKVRKFGGFNLPSAEPESKAS